MNLHDVPETYVEGNKLEVEDVSRRKFLEASVFTLSGTAALAIAGVGARFLADKAFETPSATWVQVGSIIDLPAGYVHRATYGRKIRDAWRKTEQKGVVYLYSEDGVSYSALDGTCSHLGCIVHWKESENHFSCPCHAGYFQRSGEVLEGPPPRSLRTLATKIEEGVLWVEV